MSKSGSCAKRKRAAKPSNLPVRIPKIREASQPFSRGNRTPNSTRRVGPEELIEAISISNRSGSSNGCCAIGCDRRRTVPILLQDSRRRMAFPRCRVVLGYLDQISREPRRLIAASTTLISTRALYSADRANAQRASQDLRARWPAVGWPKSTGAVLTVNAEIEHRVTAIMNDIKALTPVPMGTHDLPHRRHLPDCPRQALERRAEGRQARRLRPAVEPLPPGPAAPPRRQGPRPGFLDRPRQPRPPPRPPQARRDTLLAWVGHHDAAYRWAETRRIDIHPTTGATQIVEIRETVEETTVQILDRPRSAAPAGEDSPDADLLSWGVPQDWLATVGTPPRTASSTSPPVCRRRPPKPSWSP